ncbi:DUF4123 domain-containing protein [Pseudomonas brassicacearum]|uniref:DUF4123 domain-containing protein n=1 Tax=Pseudomonas brassicacearum subsp. neoaurantiaca TaxID=494916 RepID=A0A7V8UG54_9PSED|nr:DUF4123 domain-containing protein [Pseudomonas brassicacearum]MBA1380984.1 DUF4123 domain-containing protein [Pseudomonas brassicacearum subsp. neoaurantiaca]
MQMASEWQDQIEHVCAAADASRVDLLLDQTGWNNCAIPALKQIRPEIPWHSLFSGTPEENLLEQAPLLMRLDLAHWQHRAWLEQLITHCATDARLLIAISPLPFDALSYALQALSQIRWGGHPGLLRYYDPRIFPLLISSILSDEQRIQYLLPVSYWTWLDRDDQPQWRRGASQARGSIEVPPFVELSDEQCDLIGCISDAQQILNGGEFDHLEDSKEERFALLYRLAVQAGKENYFGNLNEYVKGTVLVQS